MKSTGRLSQYVAVKGRYYRSVNLGQDLVEGSAREGYIVTPTAQTIADRIVGSLRAHDGIRAWSLTGPYGTGKSAFALYLIDLLTGRRRQPQFSASAQETFGFTQSNFLPLVLVGQRGPLRPALLGALATSFETLNEAFAERTHRLAASESMNDEQVIDTFREALVLLETTTHDGLVLILDEFGKFLEYAALQPDQEDLFVMQGLAELAERSSRTFVLMTILHTAFGEYLHRADEARQAEWRKIQGRFTDLSFTESHEQLLTLIREALQSQLPEDSRAAYQDVVTVLISSDSLWEARKRYPLHKLLPGCVPLHPTVALLLPPLFKSKLAQNERSLFTFLTNSEPFGFQDFLDQTVLEAATPSFFRLDHLYDYISTALGAATFRGEHARRWSELDHALHRVAVDAPILASSMVKAVGLLSMYGAGAGLRADRELLQLAFGDGEQARVALDYLEQASIIIYRKHEQAYGLWEGSDVDLEVIYNKAIEQVGQSGLAERLSRTLQLQPMVARAHYLETGTLRAFDIVLLDGTEEAVTRALHDRKPAYDGRIYFVLATNGTQVQRLRSLATFMTEDDEGASRLHIVGFPRPLAGLTDVLREVETWRWVEENTPALKGDPVARKEVQSRLEHALNRLENLSGETFGLRGHPFKPQLTEWVQMGNICPQTSSQNFLRWLSDLCNSVFDCAPDLKNELINRENLSSAATAARNALLKAMLANPGVHRHEVPGTPPEVSMYEAVLAQSGIHRLEGETYVFGRPTLLGTHGDLWRGIWDAIEAFLFETATGRRSVRELYDRLKHPPYGLKEGPLPVLLLAVLLARREQVALYKEGMFVPELRDEILELLARNPGVFELQQYAFGVDEQAVLAAVRTALTGSGISGSDDTPGLVKVIKSLVVFAARLQPYAKNTRRLDPKTLAVREALIRTKDPHSLLFEELPQALGVSLHQADASELLSESLQFALLELKRCFPSLLDEIEGQLRATFHLTGSYEEAREQLRQHFGRLDSLATESTVAIFVREASRLSTQDWRESLARVVNKGLPVAQWTDSDVVSFQVRLNQLQSDLNRLEELVAERRATGANKVLRIGWLDGTLSESREVISVTPDMEHEVMQLMKQMQGVLNHNGMGDGERARRIRLAALAHMAADWLKSSTENRP